MVRVLAVCGNGQGSSMVLKMKMGGFLKKNNIDHELISCAFGEYKSMMGSADIIVASTHLADDITVPAGKHVVGVKNLLSEADFGPKLMEVIQQNFASDVR